MAEVKGRGRSESPCDPQVTVAIGAWLESRTEVEPGPQSGSRAGPMAVCEVTLD